MGNSPLHRPSHAAAGQVILSNGTLFTYNKPLTVAELMLEHPQEVVVEFHPANMNGKKPIPLPADHALEIQKLYLMLPIRKGKPAQLSSEQARQLLTKTASLLKTKALQVSYTGVVPLLVRMCHAVGVKHEALLVEKEEDVGEKGDYFRDILEGRPEFLSRQISGKGWKPSLDPIKEKTMKAKGRHWVF